jgi:hypothetical protein
MRAKNKVYKAENTKKMQIGFKTAILLCSMCILKFKRGPPDGVLVRATWQDEEESTGQCGRGHVPGSCQAPLPNPCI